MNKFFIKYILPFIFCIAMLSCKKFIEVDPPVSQVTSANVFNDDATATSAVTGLYARIMGNNLYFLNGATTLYPALSADELYTTLPDPAVNAFFANAIPAESNIIQNDFWSKAYNYIYQVNACISGLENSTRLSLGVKQGLTGEMKFMRGLCYFYLVNLFGDVPLVLDNNYSSNASLPRAGIEKVYLQIIGDLKAAGELLSPDYPSPDFARPNKFSASALLARVYLYREQWQEAEAEAGKVISSGLYTIEEDINEVFLKNSREVIFQMAPVIDGLNTAEGQVFIPYSPDIIPSYILTSYLMDAFEAGDRRRSGWVDSNIVSGEVYYHPYKYKTRDGTQVDEYNIVLRLAEQYLIRAEARAKENNINGAVSDLNIIRKRSGLQPLANNIGQDDCLSAIDHENRIEFFAEWGHRWMDLKRMGKIDSVLSIEKSNWQTTDALYPIPFSEIQANTALIQNPGY